MDRQRDDFKNTFEGQIKIIGRENLNHEEAGIEEQESVNEDEESFFE